MIFARECLRHYAYPAACRRRSPMNGTSVTCFYSTTSYHFVGKIWDFPPQTGKSYPTDRDHARLYRARIRHKTAKKKPGCGCTPQPGFPVDFIVFIVGRNPTFYSFFSVYCSFSVFFFLMLIRTITRIATAARTIPITILTGTEVLPIYS